MATEDEINVIIIRGPPFTQGPHAVLYSVSRSLNFKQFREEIMSQLRGENVAATTGIELCNIVLKDSSGNSIKCKKDFLRFMENNPADIDVEISKYYNPGESGFPSVDISALCSFWTALVQEKLTVQNAHNGEVVKNTTLEAPLGSVRTITLDTARWGPSFAFSVMVERLEYLRCWELIRSNAWQFISLRGAEGVGKSVFLYWLIYKITTEAKAVKANILPTFLLISVGGAEGKVYEKLSIVNGLPVAERVPCAIAADYVLADIVCDPMAVTNNWNLHVGSFGAKDETGVFKVEDVKERGLMLVMEPCSRQELQSMLGQNAASIAAFSYTIFGGSARMVSLLRSSTAIIGNGAVCAAVEQELTEFLSDSEFANETALIKRAALIVAAKVGGKVALISAKGGRYAVTEAAAAHRPFVRTYLNEIYSKCNGTPWPYGHPHIHLDRKRNAERADPTFLK